MMTITHKSRWFLALSVMLFAVGCQQTQAQMVPAVVTNVSPANKAQIQQAIKNLLNREIKIADNAFSQTSDILVEPSMLKDERGLPIMGREFGYVLKLSLVTDGKTCFLQSSETGEKTIEIKAIYCSSTY